MSNRSRAEQTQAIVELLAAQPEHSFRAHEIKAATQVPKHVVFDRVKAHPHVMIRETDTERLYSIRATTKEAE